MTRSVWDGDWLPATKETLMDEPTDERPVEAFTAGQLAEILARYPDRPVHLVSPTQIAPATSTDADILEPDGPTVWLIDADWDDETAAPRASRAATATHSTGDDAGAAHDPHKPAAGHTEPRMRPEDVPEELVKILLDNIALTNPDDELDIRYGLTAVIPAIRAAIADEIEAEEAKIDRRSSDQASWHSNGMIAAANLIRGAGQ